MKGRSVSEQAKARWHDTLVSIANSITSVHNDIYTTVWWQYFIDVVLGVGALGTLIASMIVHGTPGAICSGVGVAAAVALIVFNFVIKTVAPTSFMQYTYIDKGKEYCYQVIGQTRCCFSDGVNHIEVDGKAADSLPSRSFLKYKHDFFAYMDVEERIGEAETETYIGTFMCNGKRHKASIVIKGNIPVRGTVDGARMDYYCVNDTSTKFVVPTLLKQKVKETGVNFPKIPGLYVSDGKKPPRS